MRRAQLALMSAGAVAAACCALTACGRTGPLYLPEKTGTVVTRERGEEAPPPAREAAPAEDPAEDEAQTESEDKPE
jgi:predicted small lipoprotein YifL